MEHLEYTLNGVPVTWVHVQTEEDSIALGRSCGQYISLETGALDKIGSFEGVCDCLARQLRLLLEPFFGKTLCVCGVGNPNSPADSLGPEVAKRFMPKQFELLLKQSNFKKTVMVRPDLAWYTNIPTEKMIASIASAVDAACVLIVDASTCVDIEHLCSSICLTDNGMRSYSQADLCESTIGLPVITVGVPTTISAHKLCENQHINHEFLVTSANITEIIKAASFVIACGIAQAVYPDLDYQNCKQCVEFFLHGIT